MLRTIDLSITRIDLAKLLEEVQSGTEIILMKGDKEVARIVPPRKKQRIPGLHANQGGWISEDFDEPLPDEFWFGEE